MMPPPGGGSFGPAKAGMMVPPGGRPGPYSPPGPGFGQGAAPEVNQDSLPIRQGKEDCLVYLNTGVCQNGLACIFNHPRGSQSGNAQGTLAKAGGGGPSLMSPRPTDPVGAAPLGGPPGGAPPGAPSGPNPAMAKAIGGGGMPGSPKLGASGPPGMPTGPPNGGDAPPGMPSPASVGAPIGSGTTELAVQDDERKEEKVQVLKYNEEGLPIRHGAQKCGSYLRVGKCFLGKSCRFDHPEGLGGIMAGPAGFGNFPLLIGTSQTTDGGMARRPGKDQCPFLKRTGECPFGPECRFDHAPGASGDSAPATTYARPIPVAPTGGKNKDRGLGGARGRRPVVSTPGLYPRRPPP